MQTMLKRFCKLVLTSLLGISVACAEESGAFVGVEVGYAELLERASLESLTQNKKHNSIKYSVYFGYKQFFNHYLGLRYYASFALVYKEKYKTGQYDEEYNILSLHYGGNVDFLSNFIAKENVDFGSFVGIGIGGVSWNGKYIDEIYDKLKSAEKTSLDMWLNAGLRVNIAKQHGFEIGVRVPFIKTQIVNINIDNQRFKYTLSHTYNIGVRYIASF